jgi:hypothetical protein
MTTLQLARAIADAAINALDGLEYEDHKDPPTQAVLRVLHETDSWFCRLTEDERGLTVEEKYPTQVDLEF